MTSKNEHTGQKQQTKPASETFRENYDKIFGKKPIDTKEPKQYELNAETIPIETK